MTQTSRPRQLAVTAAAVVFISLVTGVWAQTPPPTPTPNGALECSAGPHDGIACNTDDDCFVSATAFGACVEVQGICNGGDLDAVPCDCPNGTCPNGTCVGGPFDGDTCCNNCGSGIACMPSQRICTSGDFKGISCLNDVQCSPGLCASTGKVCGAGSEFVDFTCVDNADCGTNGMCQTPVVSPPLPTPTPTPAPTATSTPSTCVGDCNGDGAVTIDELLLGVNIALGTASVAACSALDRDASGTVTVDELIAAVNTALTHC